MAAASENAVTVRRGLAALRAKRGMLALNVTNIRKLLIGRTYNCGAVETRGRVAKLFRANALHVCSSTSTLSGRGLPPNAPESPNRTAGRMKITAAPRPHVIADLRCAIFVCGNDTGMPNSVVERVLRARLSQHSDEPTLQIVRSRMPPIGCFRQFRVMADRSTRFMANDRLL